MMRLLKASVMDDLKYNRYDEIANSFMEMAQKMLGANNEFFQNQFVLLVEQVIQKLIRTIPTSQAKLQNQGVQNTRQFMESLLGKDGLDVPETLRAQLSVLIKLFNVEDKSILPNEIIDSVKQIHKSDAEARLFSVMTSLPQGNTLLAEAEEIAKKRMASETNLLELGDVTTNVVKFEEGCTEIDVDAVVALWQRLNKLETDLKDKPEIKNVLDLIDKLSKVARRCVDAHVLSELGDYIASQSVHGRNKMKCLPVPQWKILALRPYLPDETVFRHGLTLKY